MNKLFTIFKIPELRRKILITALFLAVYRIGYYVPLPIIDQERLQEFMKGQQGALGQVLTFVSMFSGGTFSNSCIFALGVMPYISASIIFQLLASVYPPLEKLQKEGESGRKKINEYTRYATVFICMIQAFFWVQHIMTPSADQRLVLSTVGEPGDFSYYFYGLSAILTMTAGTIFLMWLGEQIDEYGIGNGISLIIMAGIIARIPDATAALLWDSTTGW
ncbi:MAG: preprotein translocase subunit SecY, partial [Gemmataceae bacterium]|nr:preprotein translocase subunit SecY [Gemmataceae bacterium]